MKMNLLKKYLLASILSIILMVNLSYAEETTNKEYGFKDIPFGSSYKDVKKKLEAAYGTLDAQTSRIIAYRMFDLGGKQVRAAFLFDHNYKFYMFMFQTMPKTADLIETDVYNDVQFLTEVFTNKYGKPTLCEEPRKPRILMNSTLSLCHWERKNVEISTGAYTEGFTFGAFGTVYSKKLSQEYESYEKQQKNKSAKEGAKKF